MSHIYKKNVIENPSYFMVQTNNNTQIYSQLFIQTMTNLPC